MDKRCEGCGKTKPIKQFSKNKGSQDGYQTQCKICRADYDKRYAQTDKGKEAQKRYNQSNKRKKVQKRYQQSNKRKQITKKRDAKRRASQKGDHTTNQWFALCKFYDFRCLKCNKQFPFEKLSVDHIKPVSKGGSSDIWNTQPLCKRCNSKKGNKEIDYRKTLPDWINRDGPIWIQDTLL